MLLAIYISVAKPMKGAIMQKVTEDWNEIGYEELEERLELDTCEQNYCAGKGYCGTGYSSGP